MNCIRAQNSRFSTSIRVQFPRGAVPLLFGNYAETVNASYTESPGIVLNVSMVSY